jgi:hypothetical protein
MVNSTQPEEYGWVTGEINTLRKRNFYGKLVIEWRNGSIVLLRLEETLKPPNSKESLR